MESERIELSAKERERLKVLHQVEQGHLKQIEAARRLRLSDRQVRRLQRRLGAQGDGGIGSSALRVGPRRPSMRTVRSSVRSAWSRSSAYARPAPWPPITP
jgi:Helix-turn-helix domain